MKHFSGRGSAQDPAGVAYSAPRTPIAGWEEGLFRPRPRWGSLQRSPDPLAGWEGAGCPSQRTPPSLSPLGFGLLGLVPDLN